MTENNWNEILDFYRKIFGMWLANIRILHLHWDQSAYVKIANIKKELTSIQWTEEWQQIVDFLSKTERTMEQIDKQRNTTQSAINIAKIPDMKIINPFKDK